MVATPLIASGFFTELYSGLPYAVEPMRSPDIGEVMGIDRQSFPTPWSHNAYVHEIERNDAAHYLVMRPRRAPNGRAAADSGLDRVRRWLAGSAPSDRLPIIAYGGIWQMYDEAHISTIATRPEWRGRGLGELMLVALLDQSMVLHAQLVTLEVRVSNTTAQQLYDKYSFAVVGQRRGYYTDNGEDALLMTTPSLHDLDYQAELIRLAHALRARLIADVVE